MLPWWYGVEFPTLNELEALANNTGVPVAYVRTKQPFLQWDNIGPLCIIVPNYNGPLARSWAVAHELAHLLLGHGPLGAHLGSPQEVEADEWAACALIPNTRLHEYGSPCVGSLINALSRNFQEAPPNGGIRKLAARIAYARLRTIEKAS